MEKYKQSDAFELLYNLIASKKYNQAKKVDRIIKKCLNHQRQTRTVSPVFEMSQDDYEIITHFIFPSNEAMNKQAVTVRKIVDSTISGSHKATPMQKSRVSTTVSRRIRLGRPIKGKRMFSVKKHGSDIVLKLAESDNPKSVFTDKL